MPGAAESFSNVIDCASYSSSTNNTKNYHRYCQLKTAGKFTFDHHRALWLLAGVCAILAILVLGLRGQLATTAAPQPGGTSAQRDVLSAEMLAALEKDPRVRRPQTRRLVEHLSDYAGEPALETAEAQYARGLVNLYGRNNLREAEEAFRRAARMRPGWAWAPNALGIVLYKAGREKDALEAFAEARRLDPAWSRPHSDLAILYRLEGDLEKAALELEDALQLEPENPITLYNFGVLLDVMGHRQQAEDVYREVISKDPELPAPYYNLACAFGRQGALEEALPYLQRAIALNPDFRAYARIDEDFDRVRDTPAFQAAVSAP